MSDFSNKVNRRAFDIFENFERDSTRGRIYVFVKNDERQRVDKTLVFDSRNEVGSRN